MLHYMCQNSHHLENKGTKSEWDTCTNVLCTVSSLGRTASSVSLNTVSYKVISNSDRFSQQKEGSKLPNSINHFSSVHPQAQHISVSQYVFFWIMRRVIAPHGSRLLATFLMRLWAFYSGWRLKLLFSANEKTTNALDSYNGILFKK